jgi:hypothetical protein
VITNTKARLLDDLADGAHGMFRYLVPVRDRGKSKKVVEVGLMRLVRGPGTVEALKKGFDDVTGDLNGRRTGDWVCVVYKLKEALTS